MNANKKTDTSTTAVLGGYASLGTSLITRLGVVASVILLALMIALFVKLGAEIRVDSSEREGVQRLLPLNQLLRVLQLHRGLSVAILGGDVTLSEKRAEIVEEVKNQLGIVSGKLDVKLINNPNWVNLQADWEEILEDGMDWTGVENFNRHTEMIAKLLELMVEVADYNSLSVDRELDTYYLQDTLVVKLPMLLEQLGQMRARCFYVLTKKNLPEILRLDIWKNLDQLEYALHAQSLNIEKVVAATPTLENRLQNAHISLDSSVQNIINIVRNDVLTSQLDTPADKFFWSVTELINQSFEIVYSDYIPELEKKLSNRIQNAWWQLTAIAIGTLAALITVLVLVRQVLLRNQQLSNAVNALQDENQRRKETEAELRVAINIAETANRGKTQFLANLSHEIRTPLNGVLGMAELLSIGELNESQAALNTELLASGKSLKEMLDRILDFTHIESGEVALNSGPFHLPEIFSSVLGSVRKAAETKGLNLVHSIAADIPHILDGDGQRLGQVIGELLSNAINFTESGTVSLEASGTHASDSEQYILTVMVKDSGIGVPEDKRQSIFESFVQGDGSITRKVGGNGLGLAISKALVTLMQGEIKYQPSDSEGSTFSFTIPLGMFNEEAL